eukprot:m.1419052 g.1419052  ORF g.1419052 m.1419052 type:complete len:1793 (-) comp25039_c0_seq8:263-5641(-)
MGAFSLLLWKNFLLMKRRPCGTTIQVLLPALFIAVMVGIRHLTNKNRENMCERGPDGELIGDLTTREFCDFSSFSLPVFETLVDSVGTQTSMGLTFGCSDTGNWTMGYSPQNAAIDGVIDRLKDQRFLQYNQSDQGEKMNMSITGYDTEAELVSSLNSIQSACRVGVVFTEWPNTTAGTSNFNYQLRFDAIPGGYTGSKDRKSTERKTWKTDLAFPVFSGQGPRGVNDVQGTNCDPYAAIITNGSMGILEMIYQCNEQYKDSALLSCELCAADAAKMDIGTDKPGYVMYLYMSWESVVNRAIAASVLGDSAGPTIDVMDSVTFNRFPYPAYVKDGFLYAIQFGLPLLLMLSFMYTALTITRNVVHEKERRLKESMKMMGLTSIVHWAAWFTQALTLLVVSAILMTLEIAGGNVLEHTDSSIVFVYLLFFSIATISFCFLLSTMFKKASTAAVVTAILWYMSYFPYFIISNNYASMPAHEKTGYCFISTTCMSIGAAVISEQEGNGVGVTWANFHKPISPDNDFSFGIVLFMMLFDAVVYFLLTLYIEGVAPGEFGIPKPWYFPCSPAFWCGTSTAADSMSVPSSGNANNDANTFESFPADTEAGVSLVNLRKVFGKKVAVENSNLHMRKGEITALLGHNGAGKTTTMSMITGLFPPTSGTAIVNGYDVTHDVKQAQRSLGICPQHDVLFDTLTVQEHLVFFCRLKGVAPHLVMGEVDAMLASLQLQDKRHAASKTLSGGQKRRLSCGMAFVGGSAVVILDEPTSGMDPAARRATWELIERYKEGRTILLSTHFMDEADLLGDRIAIMSDGVIKCFGSSIFLKRLYGVGYSLTMVTKPDSDSAQVLAFVQKHVPSATIQSNVGAELSILLPRKASPKFQRLFEEMEEAIDKLAIRGYGCSVTTMEEVFLKVGEGSSKKTDDEHDEAIDIQERLRVQNKPKNPPQQIQTTRESVPLLDGRGSPATATLAMPVQHNTGASRKAQQFKAMLLKRIRNTVRSKWTALVQILPPLIFTFMALEFANSTPPLPEIAVRPLDNLEDTYGQSTAWWLASPTGTSFNESAVEAMTARTAVKPSTVALPDGQSAADFLIANSNGSTARTYNFNRYNPLLVEIDGTGQYSCWFNGQGYHAIAECLSVVHGLILATADAAAPGFTTQNNPLPFTDKEKAEVIQDSQAGFNVAFSILFGVAPLVSSFVIFLVKERESKAKHVQFVSGLDAFSYWLSNFLWDLVNYTVPILCVFMLFAIKNVEAYIAERFPITLVIFFLYAVSIIPLVYCFSFLFKNPSIAFIACTIFNIATGLALMVTVMILKLIEPSTADTLKNVFIILPNFCFGQALSELYTQYENYHTWEEINFSPLFCEIAGAGCPSNKYWSWHDGVGKYLVAMAVECVLFSSLVILIEKRVLEHARSLLAQALAKNSTSTSSVYEDCAPADEDVVEERRRVRELCRNPRAADDVVLVSDLKKDYHTSLFKKPKRAVNGVSVGIAHNECFGLLGVNGAGKTTTFKILTGDENLTDGHAFLKGHDITTDMNAVRQHIGYCPQYDALIDILTGREILAMFAALRGVPAATIPGEVESLISFLMLEKHADKPSMTYSGGNKRKLSTGIALVGSPKVVFLDEPTSGMDPGARRKLWNAVLAAVKMGTTIVLTSHSMEECEALCHRLTIMVGGRLMCIGSPGHLKNKFGQGFHLTAKIKSLTDGTRLKGYLTSKNPGMNIVTLAHTNTQISLQIVEGATLAQLFGWIEDPEVKDFIADYSLDQTTLEQVFLTFAANRGGEDDAQYDAHNDRRRLDRA